MTARKFKLTDKKARWAKNRDVFLRGKRLNYNASLQMWYRRALNKLVKRMTLKVRERITELFERLPVKTPGTTDESIGSQARILMNRLYEEFQELFNVEAKKLSDQMLDRTVNTSESNLAGSLEQLSGGLKLKTSIVTPEITNVVNASIAENVSLIKSIPQQYFKDITGSVMRSITSGQGLYDLLPEIRKYSASTARRTELLALDQTRKAYTSVNVAKMQEIGTKKFEWVHSGGGQEPRHSHQKILDGKVFSFENLIAEQTALGVPKPDQGLPGYPINCRCTMIPVYEFEGQE